jgi:hypothetical protein
MDLRRRSKNRVVEAMAGGADLAIRQESAATGPIDMTTLTPLANSSTRSGLASQANMNRALPPMKV